ncbi:MAG: hypothetical protein IT458_03820 [Planctomycetes bacterium]|nr:hypothetical protein [Planctomycetota bacterium]
MSTITIPDFLSSVASATDSAARADRIALADLVGALAAGKRPSIDATATASLLQRLNLTGEVLEELVATRQRLDHLLLEAAREPELRSAMRDALEHHTREMEEIKVAESALRARREAAEGELRRARSEVEQAQVAGRAAADAVGELLALLHPSLQHELRTAASGIKVSSGKLIELRRRITETEGELKETASAEFSKVELKATKLQVLQDLLERLRRELHEVEEQHERARREHEALSTEARLLVGEECTR